MKNLLYFAILGCLFSTACQQQNKYESIAKGLCACMRPMADLQIEINQMMAEGRQDELQSLFEKAESIDTDGAACIEELEKKHGTIKNAVEESKAMEAMRKICPDIIALMEGTDDMDYEDLPPGEVEEIVPDSQNQQGQEQ